MDEPRVILKARDFVRKVGVDAIPVSIERFAEQVNAVIKVRHDLNDDESGQTIPRGGKHIIFVNGNHREERQRFTVLHEVAHIALELPSKHEGSLLSYRRRPKEEVLCDVFAAECLLPYEFFKKDVDDIDISFDAIRELGRKYKASLPSTGSRFALHYDGPCAFVLMEHGKIRYVSSSKYLREIKGWIDIGVPVPEGSVASRAMRGAASSQTEYDEIATDIWFTNGVRGYQLVAEESVRLAEWDQCLSLLWLDGDLQPRDSVNTPRTDDDDEPLLEELDGVLPWPSKSRRR